jgi:2TM domain
MSDATNRTPVVANVGRDCRLRDHAVMYVGIGAALAVVAAVVPNGHSWLGWTLGGWGIGLAGHAVSVGASAALARRQRREVARKHGERTD